MIDVTRLLVMLIAFAIACVAIRGIAFEPPPAETSTLVQADVDLAPPPAAPFVVAIARSVDCVFACVPAPHEHRHVCQLFRPPRAPAFV